jgi:hypothetical protein
VDGILWVMLYILVWLTSSYFNHDGIFLFPPIHRALHREDESCIDVIVYLLNECVHNIQFPATSTGKLQPPLSVEAMTDSLLGDTTFVTLSFR